jgi:hypothetical protein
MNHHHGHRTPETTKRRKRSLLTNDRFFYPAEAAATAYDEVRPNIITRRQAEHQRKLADRQQQGRRLEDMTREQLLAFLKFRESTRGVRQLTVRAKAKAKAGTLGPKFYEAGV